MGRFLIRRLLQTILVLWGATIILFAVLFLFGDPFQTTGSGKALSPAARQQLTHKYGLDRPLPVQYVKYVGRLVQGDFGTDYQQNRSVNSILLPRIGVTARLAVFAICIEIVIGILTGIVAAVFRYSLLDTGLTVLTTIAIGLPVFAVGLILQYLFTTKVHLLPLLYGNGGFTAYILPAITLALVDAALVARLTRGNMLEVMRADFVRTASAKGLARPAVIFKHVLRNSIIPVITYLGISFGTLLGGAVITESIFDMPGLGNELITAVGQQNNPIIMGVVIYAVLVFVLLNLVIDLLYAALDPRIRLE